MQWKRGTQNILGVLYYPSTLAIFNTKNETKVNYHYNSIHLSISSKISFIIIKSKLNEIK